MLIHKTEDVNALVGDALALPPQTLFTFSVPWTPLAGWPSPGDLSQSNSFKCLKRKHVE